jgi:SPP1 family predicted phage head-tail adaptor
MAACTPSFASMANNKVTIQYLAESVDAYGSPATTWSLQSKVWAVIEPASGREVFASQQLQSRVTHKVTIRYQSALKDTATTARYRMLFDDRTFDIVYSKNLHADMKREGKEFQVLYCNENGAEFE